VADAAGGTGPRQRVSSCQSRQTAAAAHNAADRRLGRRRVGAAGGRRALGSRIARPAARYRPAAAATAPDQADHGRRSRDDGRPGCAAGRRARAAPGSDPDRAAQLRPAPGPRPRKFRGALAEDASLPRDPDPSLAHDPLRGRPHRPGRASEPDHRGAGGSVAPASPPGCMPAPADLLGVVARLPLGSLVLPGLDTALDERGWTQLEPSHPQFGLARLLASLGIDRTQVRPWPGTDAAPSARMRLISEVMRPAAATDAWRRLDLDLQSALQGVTRIDCAGPEEEARTVALLLRQAIEHGERSEE